jgi:hypothetical protein
MPGMAKTLVPEGSRHDEVSLWSGRGGGGW